MNLIGNNVSGGSELKKTILIEEKTVRFKLLEKVRTKKIFKDFRDGKSQSRRTTIRRIRAVVILREGPNL